MERKFNILFAIGDNLDSDARRLIISHHEKPLSFGEEDY